VIYMMSRRVYGMAPCGPGPPGPKKHPAAGVADSFDESGMGCPRLAFRDIIQDIRGAGENALRKQQAVQ